MADEPDEIYRPSRKERISFSKGRKKRKTYQAGVERKTYQAGVGPAFLVRLVRNKSETFAARRLQGLTSVLTKPDEPDENGDRA